MAPTAIDRITDGTGSRTEFQKPTLMPSQSSPVQASAQALTQGSQRRASLGQAKMLPSRISSIVFSEVTTMIQSGSRKNSAAMTRKA